MWNIGDAPNYLKFMPKNSYINSYDFASIDSLVSHLKFVSSNQTEYEKYVWFKKMKTSNQTLVYYNNNNNNKNKNNETELSEFVKESRLYFQYIGAHVDQNLTLGLLTPLNIKTDINKALVINKAKKTQDKNLLKNFYEDLRKIFLRKYFIKI